MPKDEERWHKPVLLVCVRQTSGWRAKRPFESSRGGARSVADRGHRGRICHERHLAGGQRRYLRTGAVAYGAGAHAALPRWAFTGRTFVTGATMIVHDCHGGICRVRWQLCGMQGLADAELQQQRSDRKQGRRDEHPLRKQGSLVAVLRPFVAHVPPARNGAFRMINPIDFGML